MTMQTQTEVPPQTAMIQIIYGKCVSRCISLLADLASPDWVADGPKDVVMIASGTGTNPDALYRVFRIHASVAARVGRSLLAHWAM